ncbi:glycoside hydrolase family 88 protein [uncultured Bacteroides sp.]|jgi:hypothetical protein|uniref:glycoside hydrolase family 88 protein n=1 Tax=uncultured Bacteroides sp. TaxID=162156 RepID=UPI00280A81F7|nr:glycoside hydrolase family 88 protein [uncultured Bacteroides sp.]
MKIRLVIFYVVLFAISGCIYAGNGEKEMKLVIEKGLGRAIVQAKRMACSLLERKERLPRSIGKQGQLSTSDARAWTSGFFPGLLWYLYEVSGDDSLRIYADDYTRRLEKQQYTTDNHDVGFMLYCSYGNGWRLTKDESYKKVLLQGAKSLSTRFRPTVGCIRSWNRKPWQYAVIIDNMMNLELLMWASKNSDNSQFASIARSHADVTMKNHFREDYSCYHVVSYDTISGRPEQKCTYQGYADDSDWSRGQAWALYGYTMMYRETKKQEYLEQAVRIAHFLMGHPQMPEDKIPYWDFDDPDIPNTPRDASAAAIMASALVELSQYVNELFSNRCLLFAKEQLKALTSPAYLAEPGTNCNFVLKHSVSNKPKGTEVDKPLTYADYYYVEALLRYKQIVLKEK